MRITENTSLDDLWKLRRAFAPRWGRESEKIREARLTLSGSELVKAEQEYRDFETVATSVIVITDLRQHYYKAKEELAKVNAALSEATSLPGKPMEDLKLKDLQADGDGIQARYLRERGGAMASLRDCEAAVTDRSWEDASHMLKHAVADAGIRLSWAESCRSVLTDVMVREFWDDKRALRRAMEAMKEGNRDSAVEHLGHRLGKAFV